MKCQDRQFQTKLADYVMGKMSAADKASVERHCLKCESCAASIADLIELATHLPRLISDELKSHISTEDMVQFAERTSDFEQEKQYRIEFHLLICSECNQDYELLQNLSKSLEAQRPTNSSPSWQDSLLLTIKEIRGRCASLLWKPGPAYAIASVSLASLLSLLIVVVVGGHYLGQSGSAGLEAQRSTNSETYMHLSENFTKDFYVHVEPPISSQDLTVLSEQTRGQEKLSSIRRTPLQGEIRLLIQQYWPDVEKYFYQVEVETKQGTVLLKSDDFKGLGPDGLTQFVISSKSLPDGTYFLRITPVNRIDSTSGASAYYLFELKTIEKQ